MIVTREKLKSLFKWSKNSIWRRGKKAKNKILRTLPNEYGVYEIELTALDEAIQLIPIPLGFNNEKSTEEYTVFMDNSKEENEG